MRKKNCYYVLREAIFATLKYLNRILCSNRIDEDEGDDDEYEGGGEGGGEREGGGGEGGE